MLSMYNTSAYTTSGSVADQTASAYMGSMPDVGFGLNDFSGTAATDGTELGPIVGPYSGQIDGAAAGLTETAMSTWQGTQQQTTGPQFTTDATPGAGDVPSTSGVSGATDPWVSEFFGDGQTPATNSTVDDSDVPEQQSGNGDDADAETADGDFNLPEPTVSGGFTTTTTVNGDATTTNYTLTSSISLESGSLAGGDQTDDGRWEVPAEWTDKAGTIPDDSDESASEDRDIGRRNGFRSKERIGRSFQGQHQCHRFCDNQSADHSRRKHGHDDERHVYLYGVDRDHGFRFVVCG
jgi:hypothetical protein